MAGEIDGAQEGADGQDGSDKGSDDGAENKVVPQKDFDKVYGQMKTLERQIGELQKGKDEGTITPEQKKELEAKTYLKNMMKETLAETEKESSERNASELKQFEADVSDILGANTDVKKDDFLKFLEDYGDDYSSVEGAMRGFKRQGEVAKDASDETKRSERRKPDMPKSDGASGDTTDYTEKDKGKSIWQVAQEAIKEYSSKGKK